MATKSLTGHHRRVLLIREPLLTLPIGFVFASVLTTFYVAIWELRLGPNPTFELVNLLIDYSPGAVATWAIETFGHLGKILPTTSGIGLWMVFGGLIAAGVRPLTSSDNGRARLAVYAAFSYLILTILVMLSVGIDRGIDILILLATAAAWGFFAQWFVQPEAELPRQADRQTGPVATCQHRQPPVLHHLATLEDPDGSLARSPQHESPRRGLRRRLSRSHRNQHPPQRRRKLPPRLHPHRIRTFP